MDRVMVWYENVGVSVISLLDAVSAARFSRVMLCPANVATRTSGASVTLQALPGKALVGSILNTEGRGGRWSCVLGKGAGPRGSLVMKVVKGFHGPLNLGEGAWVLRGTTWRQGRAGRRGRAPGRQ